MYWEMPYSATREAASTKAAVKNSSWRRVVRAFSTTRAKSVKLMNSTPGFRLALGVTEVNTATR